VRTVKVLLRSGKVVEYRCDTYVLVPNTKSPELAEFRLLDNERHTYSTIAHLKWSDVVSIGYADNVEMQS
jgi:hypothetical protein